MTSPAEQAGAQAAYSLGMTAAAAGHSAAEVGEWLAGIQGPASPASEATAGDIRRGSGDRQFTTGFQREAGFVEAGLSEMEAADRAAQMESEAEA